MKLIEQSAEIWEQFPGLEGIYKQIERAGRVCYKSEDKITEDSAKAFVNRLIESKHYAMLEHGTVYLDIPDTITPCHECGEGLIMSDTTRNYWNNVYAAEAITPGHIYITTNFRVIVENSLEDDLKYLCEPTKHHIKRVTVHCTTNRQVTHELVRHRAMSFAQESTRYCNYTKGKFGEELTFIKPCWEDASGKTLKCCLEYIENCYFALIQQGWVPQQAATILPNAIKAEIVVTGFTDDWEHLFNLRVLGTTGAPHPQMKELMAPVYEQFKQLKLL